MFEAEFWVAIAFLLFIGVLGYFGAHKRLVNSIDDRRERIKAEDARYLQMTQFLAEHALPYDGWVGWKERDGQDGESSASDASHVASPYCPPHVHSGIVAPVYGR